MDRSAETGIVERANNYTELFGDSRKAYASSRNRRDHRSMYCSHYISSPYLWGSRLVSINPHRICLPLPRQEVYKGEGKFALLLNTTPRRRL